MSAKKVESKEVKPQVEQKKPVLDIKSAVKAGPGVIPIRPIGP